MTILVLQPTRPVNPPALRARADALLAGMLAANPQYTFEIHQDTDEMDISLLHPSRYARHAAIRNHMLDAYLTDKHTHVLWIDSDLVDYPADLPTMLLAAEGDIVAPLALLDPSPARLSRFISPMRFYDIGGFIERGHRANLHPPFFVQQGPVIELDCVGCCYIAPAALYRAGVRYRPAHTDYYVEHWSVMQAAQRRGYRIVALTDIAAVHAWLPDYGMEVS